ncbi:MAG: MFS transporter [Proteobacteria bacterium]|nr:MFS transporter [Pseudomonadota bacterium]
MPASQPQTASIEAVPPISMWPALALGMAAFLTNFDVTAVIVALPMIARELRLGVADYAWVMDAYSLAFTGSLLVAGALSDRYGRRKAMLLGNLVLAAASVGCGLAWDGLSLSLARAVQGIAGAFIVTGGIALIATTYPQAESRTRAFSWLGVMSGIAMALGPTLGGVVSSWFGWRWIFLANIPACALVAWGVPRLVDEARETIQRPVDIVGTTLLTGALFILIEALLHARSAPTVLSVGCGLAALLLVTFVIQQRRRTQPIFDPTVFLRPAMIGIALLLASVSIGYWALLVYLPPFLTAAFGLSADMGGIAMLAATVPMLFVPPLGGKSVTTLGWRWHFALALTIMTVGSAVFVAALASSSQPQPWLVVGAMILSGIGAALAHPQLSGAVIALVPAEQAGMASAVTIIMRQAGFAIGIAVLGALLSTTEQAAAYRVLFECTTVACGLGALAAITLLRPKSHDTGCS